MPTGLPNDRRSAGRRLLVLLTAASAAWPGGPLCADEPAGTVSVELAEGPARSGRLILLDADRIILETSPAGELTLPRSRVLSLRFAVGQAADTAPRAWLLFPNGDRAALEALRTENEALVCRWRSYPAWKPFRVPLETASGLIVNPPGPRDRRHGLMRELSRGPFDADVLILVNRDRLSGELLSVSPEHYELNTPVGPVQAPTAQVQAVAFNSSLVSFPETPDDTLLATLTDGSWLTLIDGRLDSSGNLSGESLFGEPVAFSSGSIESLLLCGPRFRFLSTLTPSMSQTQPYLAPGVSALPNLNRTVRGAWLSLRGREFPRGLGVTSASRITYPLNGEYRSFRATVGIDDEANGDGSVVFVVDVDGRRAFTSPQMTGHSQPIDIGPLDLSQAQHLTLIVEYSEYGDILDYANWGNPILLRPE
jgi:hypothetical protein